MNAESALVNFCWSTSLTLTEGIVKCPWDDEKGEKVPG